MESDFHFASDRPDRFPSPSSPNDDPRSLAFLNFDKEDDLPAPPNDAPRSSTFLNFDKEDDLPAPPPFIAPFDAAPFDAAPSVPRSFPFDSDARTAFPEPAEEDDLFPRPRTAFPEPAEEDDLFPQPRTAFPEPAEEDDLFPQPRTAFPEPAEEDDLFPQPRTAFPEPAEEDDLFPDASTANVAKIFSETPGAAQFLTSPTSGRTTLNGVAATFEDVRAGLERSLVGGVRDFSTPEAKNAALNAALQTLRTLAGRLDPAVDFATDETLREGWEYLTATVATTAEMRRARFLTLAEEAFARALEQLANGRALCALAAGALAQSHWGDFPGALATLEALATRRFDAARSDAARSYWSFLRFQFAIRDYLSLLGGNPLLADLWSEYARRFQTSANRPNVLRTNVAARRQAFELYLATSLLATNLESGAEALRAAAEGPDASLNRWAATLYETTFGTRIRRQTPERLPKIARLLATVSTPGTRLKFAINGVKFAFRYCPPGVFSMGSPDDETARRVDERRREVRLTQGFWILETPTTQGMWKAALGSNPSSFSETGEDAEDVVGLNLSNFPVENVSWSDCQHFLQTLNAKRSLPSGYEFRLPTEAEWEYACRAGSTAPFAGADLDSVAWRRENSEFRTRETGTKAPNAWGLSDMLGNVYEWCADWYGVPTGVSATDPKGPETGVYRVVRGGCWISADSECRCAAREKRLPTTRDAYCGFRLVFARIS